MRDITQRLARRLSADLDADELVLAGVAVAAAGTFSAAITGAARAADGPPSVAPDGELARTRRRHEDQGLGRAVGFYLLLTDRRVLLVARNAFGLARGVVLDVPVSQVEHLRPPTRSMKLTLVLVDGRTLALEAPKAPKFLPPVYRQLGELLARAKSTHPE